MNLIQIGSLVHQRRQELGLSQSRLAKLSGLSRATINQLESGTIQELGSVKLFGLLSLLGITLQARHLTHRQSALDLVGQTASVSYKKSLNTTEFAEALVAGELPSKMLPYVATVLDETPLPLVVSAVEEIAKTYGQPPKLLWKNVSKWAEEVQTDRAVWT